MDMDLRHVIVVLAANVGFIMPTGADSAKGPACDWIICNRRKTDESFSCNNSYIFVENVTDFWGADSNLAYQNMRQMCMGARSCDPTRICNGLRMEMLRVRYVCVNVSEIFSNNQCEWPVETIWRNMGHIQSPNYPAPFPSQSCSWRISAPEDRFVHISVHDMSYEKSSSPRDGGLNITYQECATGDVTSRLFRRNFAIDAELIACGSVSVQLVTWRKFSGVRFWLTFEVTSSPEAAVRPPLLKFVDQCHKGEQTSSRILSSHVLQKPVLRQLDPTVVMVSSTSYHTVTPTTTLEAGAVTSMQPPPGDKGLNTTVVIIVVSTIGAVLVMAIILAVIFLKRPKVERVEHVYAVPTPRDASPGSPPGSASPLKHDRPILKECYCTVADSIPSPRLHVTPASPGYAEVEDVCKGDNCRWDPHKFTFGPPIVIRPTPPNDLPFSKTSPNISSFALPNTQLKPGPTHNRTFSDSSHRLFSDSPYINRSTRTTRSFRDPKTTDYENIVIDEKNKSPCFVQSDQKYLLQSRLGRVTASAKTPPEGVKCVQVSPPKVKVSSPKVKVSTPKVPSTEALYATSNVMNHTGAKLPGQCSFTGSPESGGIGFPRPGLNSDQQYVNSPIKDMYTRVNTPGKYSDVNDSDGIETKFPGSRPQGHRMQRSKGDNSVTGELPLYENLHVVRT